MVMVVVVVVVVVVPGPEREGEVVQALGRLQAQTGRLSLGLAVVVERQQGPHCVLPLPLPLPHSPLTLTRHLEERKLADISTNWRAETQEGRKYSAH